MARGFSILGLLRILVRTFIHNSGMDGRTFGSEDARGRRWSLFSTSTESVKIRTYIHSRASLSGDSDISNSIVHNLSINTQGLTCKRAHIRLGTARSIAYVNPAR